jgi:hypothetical protein
MRSIRSIYDGAHAKGFAGVDRGFSWSLLSLKLSPTMAQHICSLCSAYARAKKVKVGPELARGLELGFGLVPGGMWRR